MIYLLGLGLVIAAIALARYFDKAKEKHFKELMKCGYGIELD